MVSGIILWLFHVSVSDIIQCVNGYQCACMYTIMFVRPNVYETLETHVQVVPRNRP